MSYDPRQAYYARMTPAARAGNARRSNSQHSNMGGHDSNYSDTNKPDNSGSPRKEDKEK